MIIMKISDLQIGDMLTVPWTGSLCTEITDINETHFKCNMVHPYTESDWINKSELTIRKKDENTFPLYAYEIRPGCGYECWIRTELVMKIDN